MQAHEPVRAKMERPDGSFSAFARYKLAEWALTAQNGWRLHVDLENGQRVIVTAKSRTTR
jgi:hypothetical protein